MSRSSLQGWQQVGLVSAFLRGWLGWLRLKMVWNEKIHWLKLCGHTVVRNREVICQDPRADGEQESKLRVKSQLTPRSIGIWKEPMRRVYCCRLPAHFHELDGQSGSARGKGHSKHDPLPPPCPTKPITSPESQERSMQNPLQGGWDVSQWLSRFSLLGSGRDKDENWECVTFHESSFLGHHALYTRTLPLLLESVGVGPGEEGPHVWPQAEQSSIQPMIRTAQTRAIIIRGENPSQPQICWQNLRTHHWLCRNNEAILAGTWGWMHVLCLLTNILYSL